MVERSPKKSNFPSDYAFFLFNKHSIKSYVFVILKSRFQFHEKYLHS